MEQQLQNLVLHANKILITSHISPDADAVCSSLLLAETLKLNYPEKKIRQVLEEKPNQDYSFLSNYQSIEFKQLLTGLQDDIPELLIIVDANNFGRVSRNDGQAVQTLIRQHNIRTAIIDHHEPADKDQTDIFINNLAPASAQEVYSLCFERLNMKKPAGYAEITMLGILSDTRRFKYHNPMHRETFRIVSDLIDANADIEKLENQISRYSPAQLEVVSHLSSNAVSTGAGYNYSFVADEFAAAWLTSGKSIDDYKSGCEIFINQFIRNLGSNTWGFVVYPDLVAGKGNYAASFRALWGTDVSVIARGLGGGGHKSAAAAKVQAVNTEEVVRRVIEIIQQYPA
jgi:bifunctional oligoribonuclease and PAP phosphatase NrnA